MRSVKKLLTVLALLALCLTLMAVSAFAAEEVASGTCGDDLTWVLDSEDTLTISGTGNMYNWYSSSVPWKDIKAMIQYVVIEDGVTSIGNRAFNECRNLSSVSIADSVTYIGEESFGKCNSLDNIVIPNSVTLIKERAFWYCVNLNSITIPDSVTSIPAETFEGCTGLKEVSIPATVTTIGSQAFNGCSGLEHIEIPVGVQSIGRYAFAGCVGLQSLVIPDNVTSVYSYAFYKCSGLTEVNISESLTQLAESVFAYCTGLTDITISDSITSIGSRAFEGCTGLECVMIPDSVTYIGQRAFQDCTNLIRVRLPRLLNTIDWYLFSNCTNLYEIEIPDCVLAIEQGAFSGCASLENIYYTGNENQWSNIDGLGWLPDANIYFNSTLPALDSPVISKMENTASGIKITWDAVVGAEAYRVYVRTENGSWTYMGHTAATTMTAGGTVSGKTYYFTVCCVDSQNEVPTSSYNVAGWAQTYVAQPAITKLENTATGIKITWGAVDGAGQYRLFVKTSKGWATVGTTTGTTLTYTGAKSGYTYTFTIRALNAAGTTFVSSYNTTGWKQTYVAQPSITKLENTVSGIKVTWGAVNGAGKYRLFVKTSTGWATVGTTTGTSLTYTGAKSGYTYTFTVRALNSAGTAFVSSFNATGWKQTYVAMPSISKFENTASGIKITWNAVSGAGKYRVYVKTSTGWATVGTTTGTSLTYTGAKSGYTYTFTIRALNAAGTAFVSSYNATGWKQTYVAQPSVTKLTNTTSGIKVTWGAVNGAAKYRVFVKTSSGWKAIGTTTGTSLTWTGAKSGYTYTFTVRCLNSAGTAYTSSFNAAGWSLKRT